ncbi:hypothetical protein AB0I22_05435 [Streptomyces sp. NPDC050610]|uniref:hypothetical protein n=1 Tax=Streptomyces sp. NPDC050610 TaxID=3157097 RepID=UPI003432CC9C
MSASESNGDHRASSDRSRHSRQAPAAAAPEDGGPTSSERGAVASAHDAFTHQDDRTDPDWNIIRSVN